MTGIESSKNPNEDLWLEVLRQQFKTPIPPSLERSEEIECQLAEVAEAMSDFTLPWYIGGGLSLDLTNTSLERDHDDIDIAMSLESASVLWEYGQGKRWSFSTHEDAQLATLEEFAVQAQRGNEGIVIQPERGSKFEVVFIKLDQDGSLTGPARISLPDEPYASSAKRTLVNGEQVTLTPPEIVLLYKILVGRHKDLVDIANYLPKLTQDQRDKFYVYLDTLNPVFELDGKEFSSADELIRTALDRNSDVFNQHVDTIEREECNMWRTEDMLVATQLLEIAQSTDRGNFTESVCEKFGKNLVDKYPSEFEKVESFIFSGDPISPQQLYSFIYKVFDRESYLVQRVNTRMQLLTRWNTTVNLAKAKTK